MEKLKQKAISLGLCEPFQESWDDKKYIEMYKQGISWCLPRKYPSLEEMLPYDKSLMESDIFNNKNVDLILTDTTYILNQCKGGVEINDYNVSGLYISLDSIIDVTVSDNSILTIECYDNSIVRLKVAENAKCTVWQYGNSIIQIISGNAKIIKK